jgi:hypothetical protein
MQRGRKTWLGALTRFFSDDVACGYLLRRLPAQAFRLSLLISRIGKPASCPVPVQRAGESALFVAEEFRSDQGWELLHNSPG